MPLVSVSVLLLVSFYRPLFDKLIIFSGEDKLWITQLRDTVVLWTSVPVIILKNFNCVLNPIHRCCTTGIVMSSFILGLQHFYLPHAHRMHIFLVILDLITQMTFREKDKLWSSPITLFSPSCYHFHSPLICLNTMFSKAFLSSDCINIQLYKVRNN